MCRPLVSVGLYVSQKYANKRYYYIYYVSSHDYLSHFELYLADACCCSLFSDTFCLPLSPAHADINVTFTGAQDASHGTALNVTCDLGYTVDDVVDDYVTVCLAEVWTPLAVSCRRELGA